MFDQINGIDLNDPERGWTVEIGVTKSADISVESSSITLPGVDGAENVGERVAPAAYSLPVIVPVADKDTLRMLMLQAPVWLSNNSIEALADPKAATVRQASTDSDFVVVTGLYSIPGVYARDLVAATSVAKAINASTVTEDVFAGLTAPVDDAIVRVKGAVTGLRVADSRGSFFEYGESLAAGEYLRFEAESGRAFITETDTWTGGDEVTGSIANGPGPYWLRLTPYFTDPDSPTARLTVTTTSRTSSPVIQVRGKRAHLV